MPQILKIEQENMKIRKYIFEIEKQKMILFSLLLMLLLLSCAQRQVSVRGPSNKIPDSLTTFTNPVISAGADPWVIKDDSIYYFCFAENNGISVSFSQVLSQPGKRVSVWHPKKNSWNRTNIWAPELHKIDKKWYIYYTAGKAGPPYFNQRAGVLESLSDSPFGPYEEKGVLQTGVDSGDYVNTIWAIDPTVTRINGQLYAIWSGWEKNEKTDATPQHLFIAEMSNPYTINSSRSKIASPEEDWETGGPLNLLEGPQVLKHDNRIFIIYSTRESWTKDYRLGQLMLKDSTLSPMNADNWIKKGPVFKGDKQVYGTGHASFTVSPDDKEWWILYHSKKSTAPGWERDVRLQQFFWDEKGEPMFDKPVEAGVPVKRPGGDAEILYRMEKNKTLK